MSEPIDEEENPLTRDCGAGVEGGSDLGVQLDVHAALLRHLLVSILDLLLDPVAEVVTDHRVGHVGDPLLGQLLDLLLDWVVGEGLRVLVDEVVELEDSQGLVLRDLQVHGLLVLDD